MKLRGIVGLLVGTCLLGVASVEAQTGDPVAAPVAPPAAAPKRSATDLEKLVAPIALYPDSLLAAVLPAASYPTEIVLAARFVADPANAGKSFDDQPWDVNVKALASVPAALEKLEKDLEWTVELGQAFIEQSLDVMDAIQRLRAEAQKVGTLKTTPEQVVKVGEATVEREYEGETIYVTNSVITIEPAKTEVIYVPVYDPVKAYEAPPSKEDDDDDDDDPPAIVSFAVAVGIGAIIANNCDWCYGGVMIGGGGMVIVGGGGHPPYYPPPPYYRPPPYYPPPGYRPPPPGYRPPGVPPPGARPPGAPAGGRPPGQHWQPDQNRVATSGSNRSQPSAASREARGWGDSPAPSTRPAGPGAATGSVRPAPAIPSAPSSSPSLGGGGGRSAPTPAPSINAPSRGSSGGSAFGGVGGGSRDRDFSRRGASSRGAGGRGGGRR